MPRVGQTDETTAETGACDVVHTLGTTAMRRRGWELAKWESYLLAAGRPASTVTLRRYHLERILLAFPKGPGTVDLDGLVQWLAEQDWSPNTRRAYRASLRGYYSWAMATGRVTESPAHLLPPIKVPRAKPRPAPEEAVSAALESASDPIRIAIRLAAQCGLRRGEIARVQIEDVERDMLGWSLRVIGKGGHVRLVPLPDELAATIRSYPAGWLFPSPRGGHMTPHHLGKRISRELPEGYTTHTLRHRCGTTAYGATKDLRAVQELLGHAKPETTAIYTAVPDRDVRLAMQAAVA